MANEGHLDTLNKGVEAWNSWRNERPDIRIDLCGADLTLRSLSDVNFENVDLQAANLNAALLDRANLDRANLFQANLRRAHLRQARLFGAILEYADLRDADLSWSNLAGATLTQANLADAALAGANLCNATLRRTNLTNCYVGWTQFDSVDLSCVEGLESVHHLEPSIISIDTIYLSEGKIPQVFLRGAGVPDNFIEYIHSLVGTAFEFYSCFISYSGKDQEFADRIHADLQDNGVRCWFAPHDVQAGKKLHEQIDDAIRLHERLLLILSPNSIHSQWVKTEIAKARKRELKEGKRILFPIRLNISFEQLQEWECFDADRGKDSAREIREYYIPDFTRWKDRDQYQEEFHKLLRDLKKETVIAATP